MADIGYWAVIESLTADSDAFDGNGDQESGIFSAKIEGFFYTDVLSFNKQYVREKVKEKLKDNIRFLLACYADIPAPSPADTPPQKTFPENTTLSFISLDELGLNKEDLLQDVA